MVTTDELYTCIDNKSDPSDNYDITGYCRPFAVSYGECKITVRQEDEAKEFTVEGGGFLLPHLTDHGINITSSCAGKASCGYCKVQLLSGGGPILPTEEIFMSKEEKFSGTRLACQVKIKEDMEIYIPDFLTTVKTIVANKTYDSKLRWRFIKTGFEDFVPEKRIVKLVHKDKAKIHGITKEYKDVPGAVIPVLQRIDSIFNYLPEPALRLAAKELHTPLSELYRMATFYSAFSLKPRGKHLITVCLGTACHVKGAGDIMEPLESQLGIKAGETTEDMMFSLEGVRCIGCCGLAPVLKIGEDVHGLMKVRRVPKLIEMYRNNEVYEKTKC